MSATLTREFLSDEPELPLLDRPQYTLQAYIIMARSERHADQYSSECLAQALRHLTGQDAELIRRVLAMRAKGLTLRVTGRGGAQ